MRKLLGIKTGEKVVFETDGEKVIVRKVKMNPIDDMVGLGIAIFVSILNKERNYRTSKEILESTHSGKHEGATSVICLAELMSGFYSKGDEKKGERFFVDVKSINNFRLTDVDLRIAKEAAKIRGRYGIRLPDAIIAATCKSYACTLITKAEIFEKIEEIDVKRPEEV